MLVFWVLRRIHGLRPGLMGEQSVRPKGYLLDLQRGYGDGEAVDDADGVSLMSRHWYRSLFFVLLLLLLPLWLLLLLPRCSARPPGPAALL